MDNDLRKRIAEEVGPRVALMLDGWTLEPYPANGANLVHEDGRTLWLRPAGHTNADRGRIKITGGYPDVPHEHIRSAEYVSIKVSADRAASTIAKDIERRLLPEYTEHFAAVKARCHEDKRSRELRDGHGRTLERLWPGSTYYGTPANDERGTQRSHMEGTLTFPHGLIDRFYGEIKLSHDGLKAEVSLRSCDFETVRQIVAVLGRPEPETSAIFGQDWLVEIEYNTDFDGREIDPAKEEYPRTFHGAFETAEEAEAWMNAYPDGDTDMHDMRTVCINRVTARDEK